MEQRWRATNRNEILHRPLVVFSVLHVLADAVPQALVVLLPQADFVVAARHAENVSGQRPADVPNDIVKRVEDGRRPCRHVVGVPDDDATILGAAGDAR